MSEEPGEWESSDRKCPKCKESGKVRYRTVTSSDGAYDDDEFQCACGHHWWVDGIDS